MKKLLIILVLLGLGTWVYSRYGYLLQSAQNFPQSTPVDESPTDLVPQPVSDDSLSYLHLRPGYDISYYAKDVQGARSLAHGNGVVYVGTRAQGVVYAIVDNDKDGLADKRYVVASGLNHPNGVVYTEHTLYVAEINRIIKFENIDETFRDKPKPSVVYDQLPKEGHHGWRYMALGPDGKLYLGIGAPCNNCENADPYGSIARLNLDGTGFEIIARGVRNTVGFDWNPEDLSFWFTENGRDEMGDDVPRDELNQLRDIGENFGFPYCHEGSVLDPKFGTGKNCDDYAIPALNLSPHAAALGMKFVDGRILIAEHGSWNRKTPIGYRVMSVDIDNGKASNYQVFVDGWLGQDGKAKGRPVDILVMPDESILVSDDFADVIYKITKKLD